MLEKLKNIFKKIASEIRIRKIRKSEYFDETYYLVENLDVQGADLDPATHFYNFGWKENRKPNINFSTESFFEKYPEARQLQMDPISYIFYKSLEGETRDITKTGTVKASHLIRSFFPENTALKTLPVKIDGTRINIIFNGFNKGCFFAGKATALILAVKLAQKYGYRLRIISQNPDKKIFSEFLELFSMDFDGEVDFYATESAKYLEIGEGDHFICTMWTNADAVLNTKSIQGRIFYIMQEVETFFYDHGDFHLRCFNTLTDERLTPIVNTKLLYDYLLENGYENLKEGKYFEPAFSRELLSPSEDSFEKKEKYKLFFYARPSHQRNLFYFGLKVINEAFTRGLLDSKEWEVYLAGDERIPDLELDAAGAEIHNLGIMSWQDYYDFASTVDLCYSMIYTPHPSYPPFDFICSGAVVLTNKYANKGDLSMYSKNIVSAELREKDMLSKLEGAIDLAKNVQERKQNYLNSNINNSWDEAFKEVLPFMESKIREK